MIRGSKALFSSILLCIAVCGLFAQEHDRGNNQQVLRGEVWADMEPIYGGYVDDEYPLDFLAASRRALEEAAMLYSAMIYGWSFYYDIGERARHMSENFELTPVAAIPFGDPGLRATDAEIRDGRVRLWTDYYLNESQQRRMQVWRTGTTRNAQAVGYWLPGSAEKPTWLSVKKDALEDAARAAVRLMLQGSERNRPKEAHGFISLASFPNYFIDSGRWGASARFRVQITEIVPFAAY